MGVIGNIWVCMYAFLMWLFFIVNGGHRDIWGVWVKILGFVGMLFIYLKITSKKSALELSV